MPAFVEVQEYHLPRKLFQELGGFTSGDLSHFLAKYGIEANEDGLPVFEVMNALNRARKQRGGEGTDLDRAQKEEKVQELRIKNQERLGILIHKEEAKERVRMAFQAVANMIRYAVKLSAPRVAICNNVRDCENILINSYDNALEHLSTTVKDISWEADGAKAQLGRTELVEDTEAVTG